MYLILTHDVDWGRNGPGKDHILSRRERFDEVVIRQVLEEDFNPYYGIPYIMDVEERLGVRSTFFFRSRYDDGTSIDLYEDALKDLVNGNWEVGLHNNDVGSVELVREEKERIERVAGITIKGCRVHYLRINPDNLFILRDAGCIYDSSIMYTKDRFDYRNAGFQVIHGLTEFPITFMDTYIFTYMKLSEDRVISFINESLDKLMNKNIKFATLLWHDNSIHMRGGRIYPALLEHIASRDDIIILRGIDAYKKSRGVVRKNGH